MLEKVKKLFADQLGIEESSITADSTIKGDLGADSVDVLQLLMTIEEENGIIIPDEKLAGFNTVGDVVVYLESL